MFAYAIRRILLSIPILLTVVTLIFFLVRALPGGPAVSMLGDYATPEAVEVLEEVMGLNDPLPVQYFRFIGSLLRGDMGKSMTTGSPVAPEIIRVLPYTIELTICAIIIGILLGVPLGVVTSLKRNSALDYIGRTFSLAGISLPSFYLGILLMLLFSIKLDIFPVIGGGNLLDIQDNLRHLFVPSLTLGLMMAAYITRTTRSSVLNVLGEDYVRTARAKGLPERKVIFGYALRIALSPVVSFTGVYAIILIGNSVLVEMVFSRPGLGKMMVGAINQRDYLTLQSVMVVYASLVVLTNLLTDLSYGFIDPRIRYD